jgi:hypothetical protein
MAQAYALPALLGLLALAARPAALLAACVLSVPLAFTPLSGVSLVLLVPAALYAIGYTSWRPRPAPRLPALGLLAAVVLLGAAVLPAWPAGDDVMYCWAATVGPDGHKAYSRDVERRPLDPFAELSLGLAEKGPAGASGETGCSTGIIEPPQAGIGLTVAAAALAAGLLLPRQPAPPPTPPRPGLRPHRAPPPLGHGAPLRPPPPGCCG